MTLARTAQSVDGQCQDRNEGNISAIVLPLRLCRVSVPLHHWILEHRVFTKHTWNIFSTKPRPNLKCPVHRQQQLGFSHFAASVSVKVPATHRFQSQTSRGISVSQFGSKKKILHLCHTKRVYLPSKPKCKRAFVQFLFSTSKNPWDPRQQVQMSQTVRLLYARTWP